MVDNPTPSGLNLFWDKPFEELYHNIENTPEYERRRVVSSQFRQNVNWRWGGLKGDSSRLIFCHRCSTTIPFAPSSSRNSSNRCWQRHRPFVGHRISMICMCQRWIRRFQISWRSSLENEYKKRLGMLMVPLDAWSYCPGPEYLQFWGCHASTMRQLFVEMFDGSCKRGSIQGFVIYGALGKR